MSARPVLNETTIKEVLAYYAQNSNMAATARHFGISDSTVSRLLKENGNSIPKKIEELIYNEEEPVEPSYPTERNFNIHLENTYQELIMNGGIL